MCSTVQTCIETCWHSWEGRKGWARLLLLLRKQILDWGKRCRGKTWVPGPHVSRLSHPVVALPAVEQTWDCCFSSGQRASRNCYPQLWCWGIGYAIGLGCNKRKSISSLNSASEHGQKMILSGSVAAELITQLCDDVAAQGVSALESSVMATMCNRDLNTLKCQGGGDSRFWSVSFCAENPIEFR